jgi:hypothetical protein
MSQFFISETGGTPPPPLIVETLTALTGTNPVPPNASDTIFIGTALVSARSQPITTLGIAAGNTVDIVLQLSTVSATSVLNNAGLASFNSADFTIDSFGYVSLSGTGPGLTITGNTGGPLSPTAGNWNIFGAAVAAGSTPVTTVGVASTLTVNVQRTQTIASTNAANVGLAAFNAAQFSVDGNGFVSLGGSTATTYTENSGVAVPAANNLNILGNGVIASGISTAGNIFTTGAGSTVTVNSTQAQFMTNYTQVLVGASPYTALATDYYISCVSSGGAITIKLPNAPTTNRLFIIKDNAGAASANNISITTVGGSVTIDGQTTYTIAGNYASITLLFNGTGYEVY